MIPFRIRCPREILGGYSMTITEESRARWVGFVLLLFMFDTSHQLGQLDGLLYKSCLPSVSFLETVC